MAQRNISSFFSKNPHTSDHSHAKKKVKTDDEGAIVIDSSGSDIEVQKERTTIRTKVKSVDKKQSASIARQLDSWKCAATGSGPSQSLEPVEEDEKTKRHRLRVRNKLLSIPLKTTRPLLEDDSVPAKSENVEDGNDLGDDEDDEPVVASSSKLTPLETQVTKLKRDHPDLLLIVEVGYKYRFFGNDATAAAKVLNIVCFKQRSFLTCSIPTHRLDVHVRKLLKAGHKVGLVSQIETAALKKIGSNKAGPFERRVTEVWTEATFLASSLDPERDVSSGVGSEASGILCLIESGSDSSGNRQEITAVFIKIQTGEIIHDTFTDDSSRTELNTRLIHFRPREILMPDDNHTSVMTSRFLSDFIASNPTTRMETIDNPLKLSQAKSVVQEHFSCDTNPLQNLNILTSSGYVALAHVIEYLRQYRLDQSVNCNGRFIEQFNKSQLAMVLTSDTLKNLDIFCNSTDSSTRGSLLSLLDRCKTQPGKRLLRNWIGRPLVSASKLSERTNAIEELRNNFGPSYENLKGSLNQLPDLSRGLCRIAYGRAKPLEVLIMLQSLQALSVVFDKASDIRFRSTLLNEIANSLICIHEPVRQLLSKLDVRETRAENLPRLWSMPSDHTELEECSDILHNIEYELDQHLQEIRKIIKKPSADYITVAGIEFLIEIRTSDANRLELSNWIKVSATKSQSRYHTPFVLRKMKERQQYQELRDAAAKQEWCDFQKEITLQYALFRKTVQSIATLDCLNSLVIVSQLPNYCRPKFVEENCLSIENGRHPMAELTASNFVANSVNFGAVRNFVITGPNMGGKSSYVRMVGLLTIMAQIGSYVPCDTMTTSFKDSVLTRMGAQDELGRRSTFEVEMNEMSEILRSASSKSLIILDEIGRGSSTRDGQSIASAVLEHFARKIQSCLLFITHFFELSQMERHYPDLVRNLAMSFKETKYNGETSIVFLYKALPGRASSSYGIETAADLPLAVVNQAQKISQKRQLAATLFQRRSQASIFVRRCIELSSGDQPVLYKRLAELLLKTS